VNNWANELRGVHKKVCLTLGQPYSL